MSAAPTEKFVKQESWSVQTLYDLISMKKLRKIRAQRPKKWVDFPNPQNRPNKRSYIDFLRQNKNTVHSINFGENIKNGDIIHSNIDGNNRINAILEYVKKPFSLYREHFKELQDFLNNKVINIEDIKKRNPSQEELKKFTEDLKNITEIFENMSYEDIMNFGGKRYFKDINKEDLYTEYLKCHYEDITEIFENLNSLFSIGKNGRFVDKVILNVTVFVGYTTSELNEIFCQLNKYTTTLTETELLASVLDDEDKFDIEDSIIDAQIINAIKEYYISISKNEGLECYTFNHTVDKMNGYNFLIGFQNYLHKSIDCIHLIDSDAISKKNTIPLFFRLFKFLNNNYTFTTQTVNSFIDKMDKVCKIIQEITDELFPKLIEQKVCNKTCKNPVSKLHDNPIYLLLCGALGFIVKDEEKKVYKPELKKVIAYTYLSTFLKNKEDITVSQITPKIQGGGMVETLAHEIHNDPCTITKGINRESFSKMLKRICNERCNPEKSKRPKAKERRELSLPQVTLATNYFVQNVPTKYLKEKLSTEHLFPNSSDWEGDLDKDRIGNQIPMISSLNFARGNKHIRAYKEEVGKMKDYPEFTKFFDKLMPTEETYDNIIDHTRSGRPLITNIDAYNNFCEKNENILIESYLKTIFPTNS